MQAIICENLHIFNICGFFISVYSCCTFICRLNCSISKTNLVHIYIQVFLCSLKCILYIQECLNKFVLNILSIM